MMHGFCLTEKADVPISNERRCLADGSLCIAPSWASKDSAYPWPPRPDGWVYVAKQLQALVRNPQKTDAERRKPFTSKPVEPAHVPQPVAEKPGAVTCAWCHEAYTQGPRNGGPPRRFCTKICRARASKAARKTGGTGPITFTCAECGRVAEAIPALGGRRWRYCSDQCRRAAKKRNDIRPLMAERGMSCLDCGRDDAPHKAKNLCNSCWQRAAARRRQEAMA